MEKPRCQWDSPGNAGQDSSSPSSIILAGKQHFSFDDLLVEFNPKIAFIAADPSLGLPEQAAILAVGAETLDIIERVLETTRAEVVRQLDEALTWAWNLASGEAEPQ